MMAGKIPIKQIQLGVPRNNCTVSIDLEASEIFVKQNSPRVSKALGLQRSNTTLCEGGEAAKPFKLKSGAALEAPGVVQFYGQTGDRKKEAWPGTSLSLTMIKALYTWML
ncbi:hypothetical protein RRG08_001736 [Elysia crispata]|uniref:Uncharacterized protein n=1 Tax=Elysia crispata TaxID=231223 RepID=A0AAE1AKK7_9GAST|nr:hypothetical protein RRG08_001736 [Elysia crispata]